MAGYLRHKTSVLVSELLVIYGESESNSLNRLDDVLTFVFEQINRMPWLFRCAVKLMTLLFGFSGFLHKELPFVGPSPENLRKKQLLAWSRSPLRPCRDFVRFHAAMVVLSLYSDSKAFDREGL
jgi:hypothetical protein